MLVPRTGPGAASSLGSSRRLRAGFSLLEAQVAFVLLGIGLAGACPLVVMQMKLSRKVANGINPQTGYFRAGTTFYLVPSSSDWARKLGVAAAFVHSTGTPPTVPSAPGGPTNYSVSIVAPVQKSSDGSTATVHIRLTEQEPG